jgi:hypothetical protein
MAIGWLSSNVIMPVTGEIVVALIENAEATLKYIKQTAAQVLLDTGQFPYDSAVLPF